MKDMDKKLIKKICIGWCIAVLALCIIIPTGFAMHYRNQLEKVQAIEKVNE